VTNTPATTQTVVVKIDGIGTDNLLEHLAWRAFRDWRRRREVDSTIRRAQNSNEVPVIRSRSSFCFFF
jgi:hypothetical protein